MPDSVHVALAALVIAAGAVACGAARVKESPADSPAVVMVSAAPPSSSGPSNPPWEAAKSEVPPPSLYGLHAGMSLDQVRERLGHEDATYTLKQAIAMWDGIQYDTRRELPFLLGFDVMMSFRTGGSDANGTAWYAYFKKERVVMLKAAALDGADEETIRQLGFPPSCFINGDPAGIEKTFGSGAIIRESAARTFYYYLQRGVSVMVEEGHIEVLDAFTPLSGEEEKRVAAGLRQGQ